MKQRWQERERGRRERGCGEGEKGYRDRERANEVMWIEKDRERVWEPPGDESAKRAGKWQCCALLYYDMMMEYTYGNGKPEADKDFNTLNRYE